MATDVLMPQMGESITEGTVVKWLKKVGDSVQRDEPLLEISTDKVDAEIPSPAAGVVTEILAKEGDTVAVKSVLARLGEAGEAGAGASAAAAATAPGAPAPAVAEAPRQVETPPSQANGDSRPLPSQAPPPQPTPMAPVAPQARAVPAAPPALEPAGKARSSPLVRNIAREHSVNLDEVPGTGLGGRVTKDDILSFLEQRKGAPAAPPAPAVAPAPAPAPAPVTPALAVAPAPAPAIAPVPTFAAGDRVTIEQMSNMRRRIAENMLNSRRTSAHVTTIFEIDFTNIARLRERVKKQFEAQNGAKLTFLPFVIKATIDALKALPIVNSSVEGENIVYKHDYNIGIAVALEWGLIVPVIKQADALSLTGLARASQDLANRARSKQLKPDEVSGGTFSITNFGLYGGYTAAPIINQPQVAILGLGGVHKKPWVIETDDGDAIAIRHIAAVSLSFDHRVIDGAVADNFLSHVKKTIETTDFAALL
ncbi:MAG TPA: 2-oxoglutarate dehydrogenase, E2 component, dihydrolipoamide succinyltransferase [Blastocatellia bacterium]|nr:2-oxoglutarate dehydrogenase, E2 component, dihydrolipoamide succinyltransferase [Blastocatellia bacterium]